MDKNTTVLLESGTNELEIVEFEVNGNKYGINVIKVREIILPVPVTFIPHSHPHVEGIIELRGEILPVIDMMSVLGFENSQPKENDKFIVTEFNCQKAVFRVNNVSKIHRISWQSIEKPSEIYQGKSSEIIGVIKMNGEMLLLLDFEKIMVDINPTSGIQVEQVKKLGKRERSNKKIIVAEDSPLLRKLLEETLGEAGYVNIDFFENGQEALSYLESLIEEESDIAEKVQLVITDIEMPQMDGHHLTKRIKDNPSLKKLPVIIFSSLITNELRHKGEMVGADEQVSKPEINELIKKIDEYIL
ncbi:MULTISPECIES: chemotaxis protein [Bacillus]|jgi:two-component system chemotaxis response regulator CheV|uniref:chemotaxis protein n=1 Tax=Bacillus TaxID=1386 RepID=UPI00065DCF57|nr:chemotaxis protein [Bacillus smithii]AKP46658.1 Chemotaxis protein CheV [Bacillus smithii]MED4883222.1 chemotaxis protein [Bacillus smithii]MED4928053.1 chemotaxis protein [Bacillus smithii]